jgi:hypothetical protein
METSWSILDAYSQYRNHPENDDIAITITTPASTLTTTTTPNIGTANVTTSPRTKYSVWVTEQIPRVWTGMGDTLSVLERHAHAVEAYLRALDH